MQGELPSMSDTTLNKRPLHRIHAEKLKQLSCSHNKHQESVADTCRGKVTTHSCSTQPQKRTVRHVQGKEADVVLFSCVRAHDVGGSGGTLGGAGGRSPGVGFLADVRRMNVGLTRAR